MTHENTQTLSFNDIPQAMTEVLEELRALKDEIRGIKTVETPSREKHLPVDIKRASEITGKAITTLYRYTANGMIPCYKKGRDVLFYEDELYEWVRSGRCESIEERIARAKGNIVQLCPKSRR